MEKTSVWKANARHPSFTKLKEEITTDVTVVRGGITGITAAYLLSRSGNL